MWVGVLEANVLCASGRRPTGQKVLTNDIVTVLVVVVDDTNLCKSISVGNRIKRLASVRATALNIVSKVSNDGQLSTEEEKFQHTQKKNILLYI